MRQRTITLTGTTIHRKVDEAGHLVLYTCLWSDGTEIPADWHDDNADFMELNIEFSIKEIIDDFISVSRILDEDEIAGIWLAEEERALVELHKQELQAAIDQLNQIQFWDEEKNPQGPTMEKNL